MKKMLIGFICGALIMFSGQVFADQISRVGKKVGSEAIVRIEGKEVSSAIVVDGKAYTPARDIVEKFGGTVTWVPGEKGGSNVIEIYRLPDGELVATKEKKKELESEISKLKDSIKFQEEEYIPMIEKNMSNRVPGSDAEKEAKELIAEYKDNLSQDKQKLAALESELSAVEDRITVLQGNQ